MRDSRHMTPLAPAVIWQLGGLQRTTQLQHNLIKGALSVNIICIPACLGTLRTDITLQTTQNQMTAGAWLMVCLAVCQSQHSTAGSETL